MRIALCLLFTLPLFSQFSTRNIIDENAGSVRMLQTADFDNDGDVDVVISSFDFIAWYENIDGQGTFSSPIAIQEDKRTSFALAPADFDGNGTIDLVVSFFDDDEVLWYRNNGGGVFSEGLTIAQDLFTASGVTPADLDNDGDVDIVLGVSNGLGLYWVENLDGQGNFSPLISISDTLSQARKQDAGDIDGDGDLDILTRSSGGVYLSWFENIDGLGTFDNQTIIDSVGLSENSINLIDIDNDGDLDIVSQKTDLIIWRENLDGFGTYSAFNIISDKVAAVFDTAVDDLDNDGTIDVVSASTDDNKIAWYKNLDGEGTFGTQQIIDPELFSPRTVQVADVDGDGDLDVLSAALSNKGRELVWYENFSILNVEKFYLPNRVVITPNPASDSFSVFSKKNVVSKIIVNDIHGRQIMKLENDIDNINIGSFESGIYIVNIEVDDRWYQSKLIKK